VKAVEEHTRLGAFWDVVTSYYAVGDEVPLGARFVRTLLRQLAQELLKAIRFNFACL
jgi:hypothetical protein